jgi:hypothetical protein
LTGGRSFTYTGVMSKEQLVSYFKRELNVLNELIDFKILRGQTYRREAQKHRALRQKISRLYVLH